ncbi:hypothetical protein ACFWCA_48635, partial [Streptomyces phaeochromogenes]|uniref:hypothetical protein n=1 Tax=Streptomyces phaeochromogenes TaxID=1923 RepID=UPI0036C4D5E5
MRHAPSTSPSQYTKAPARLHTLVSPQTIPRPVHTSEQLLPLERLAWENFERLCLKRAVERGMVEDSTDHADGDIVTGRMSAYDAQGQGGLYGTRGQEQQGIDLYVRLPDAPSVEGSDSGRVYLSLQSRRVKWRSPPPRVGGGSAVRDGQMGAVTPGLGEAHPQS